MRRTETDDAKNRAEMHPLLIHEWTPDVMIRKHAPGVSRQRRPAKAKGHSSTPRLLRARGVGGWRRAVGMWLVEAGLALAVRD